MKDRIRKFIDYKGVTPGELALKLDVQRSNISHVLNGRNKPGASFIEKLLTEFPDLNARWLLIGSGEMVTSKKDKVKELFDKEDFVLENNVGKEPAGALIKDKVNEIHDIELKNEPILKANDKVIDKIVIFYKDRTFRDYQRE
ncbi:MAG: helix-turn-helix transcriptional regulator [Prolixibacteraceae bacterium]|jgi:transcriptional regulator with XRE-family HTH domain|nr:helix-turn-helix transcriptional regulator [Prolixibacteraceae bacterium]MBT6005018.1 helix-turn-helix transcriptional regulator [Prolixibacteraceae bacterium]MBT6766390.1 helix-turn-helix transcriptional regulator [Prolixibacteraceae bacterium]MBT7000705.1 helix-turn-helix transcriptional regulator [Prolixibacteraceae bacterium]MBT7393611.1 helix-turn-helix transcriptional regulator [Prolixibacteraceae bacterium]